MVEKLKVFILGSERSGTSITYYAMRKVFGLPGKGESHVFPIFQRIIHEFYLYTLEFKRMEGTLASSLDVRSFRRAMADYLRDFYAKAHPGGQWVDKTPGAAPIAGVSLIKEAFPDAKVIITYRTGVEVVQSYRSKFNVDFSFACQAWATCAEATIKAMEQHPDALFVDQFDMTNSAADTARRISDYLGLPAKTEELGSFYALNRTDSLSSHDWSDRLTADAAGWSSQDQAIFKKICASLMNQLGYA